MRGLHIPGYSSYKALYFLIPLLIILPILFPSNYMISVFTQIGIFSIVTLGLVLLMGYAGQISLGHAAFMGIGAYSSAILTVTYGMPVWLGIVLGMLISAAIAYIVGSQTLKLREHFLALATLGFNIIVYIVLVGYGELTKGASGFLGIPKFQLFGFALTKEIHYYILIWVIVLLLAIISLNIVNSHIGRVLRGIHDSEIATQSLGVNIARYKLNIFVISAVYASLAGSLYAHYINFIAPATFNISTSIELLLMVAVGGSQPIWGALIGSTIVISLSEFITPLLTKALGAKSEVKIVLFGALLILVMMYIPKGFVSLLKYLVPAKKQKYSGLATTNKTEK
jgi:branched-chain amino acid transport system permease protein